MDKNVIVISTSLRSGSNSQRLAEAFAKGAGEAGNRVEVISLVERSSVSVPAVFPVRKHSTVS